MRTGMETEQPNISEAEQGHHPHGGMSVFLFGTNFGMAFFPGVERWSDLVRPTILIIFGALLVYLYFHALTLRSSAQPPE